MAYSQAVASGLKAHAVKSNGKSRKKHGDLHCKFRKQPHRTRYVAIAQMHDR